ncbi:uncharacterized protein PV07_02700 [Cladophialophora immunda]|uniref:Uncharacterized protein n=1 Tax=Cladophialophora immunda TaxID=569365 RepID=A0A0D2CLX4_9EURO|nr:uncharacterized protein PV07_02700 [Cladophialophora immunda]KIW31015.1 hypothetical protein PV07_02700 [Cladophialophora immunda]OQV05703.1 hypothetical protein CLAIMM_10394 isoform 1 [Cladophialophora immunda]OQV05704.1 hypothetical protein CLAIMM_10394 isoform 5 [Cladophialophora immunda]
MVRGRGWHSILRFPPTAHLPVQAAWPGSGVNQSPETKRRRETKQREKKRGNSSHTPCWTGKAPQFCLRYALPWATRGKEKEKKEQAAKNPKNEGVNIVENRGLPWRRLILERCLC